MPLTPDILCVLAMPRTGSSYLADLLDNHVDFHVHTELFHRNAVFLKVASRPQLMALLAAEYQIPFDDIYDRRLVEVAHHDPTRFLAFLAQHRTAPNLSLKVFPRHLDRELLVEHLIRPARVAHLLLCRDPLSTFVSQLKARLTKQWSHQDTSKLQVTIDTDEFLQYVQMRQIWYDTCRQELAQAERPYEVLNYEELIGSANESAALHKVLTAAANVGLPITENESPLQVQVRPKQDRGTTLADSVENWKAFVQSMRTRRRTELLPASDR